MRHIRKQQLLILSEDRLVLLQVGRWTGGSDSKSFGALLMDCEELCVLAEAQVEDARPPPVRAGPAPKEDLDSRRAELITGVGGSFSTASSIECSTSPVLTLCADSSSGSVSGREVGMAMPPSLGGPSPARGEEKELPVDPWLAPVLHTF